MNRVILLLLLAGCGEHAPGDFIATRCASQAEFTAHVSPLLERRCGTLDCHGVAARPLRIYGELGLRLDGLAGVDDTTEEERQHNWLASCGLEPELTDRVVSGGAPPDDLVLVRKPLAIVASEADVSGERHKGGPVLERGAAGYRCLTSWLAGDTDESACFEATHTIR